MIDKLKEIENRYDYNNLNGDFFYEAIIHGEKVRLVKDMTWLILELKRLNEILKER